MNKGESGCFVYKVLHCIGVRSTASTDEKYKLGPRTYFSPGDLVSVDLILHTPNDQNGPLLRLSDGSGWLFERNESRNITFVEQVPVDKGLWSFYVDNEPVGVDVRNHPMDQLQDDASEIVLKQVGRTLPPMERIFCDRRVRGRNGVCFYRLQGSSHASWIFDKRIDENGFVGFMVHPDSLVQTGLFAYRAIANISIREFSNICDDVKTSWCVKSNENVVCDLVRESPYNHGNGPFLRLSDGSGWLFVHKQGQKLMEEIPIQEGRWKLQVSNSDGIQLRKQPIDYTESRYPNVYAENDVVLCDRKIPAQLPSHATFYRVEGTDGWIFDRRGDHRMAYEIPVDFSDQPSTPNNQGGWTVEFVRGCAAAAKEGIEEIAFNNQNRVVSFRHPNGARINVYYTTKTIGTALDHPTQGRTQLFRRNCTRDELIEILKNPRVHTGHGYFRASKRARMETAPSTLGPFSIIPSNGAAEDVNIEEDFRNRLKDLDEEMDELVEKRKVLWQSIHIHEAIRVENNRDWWKRKTEHDGVLQAELNARLEAKRQQEAEEVRRRLLEVATRTCSYCGREFVNRSAMRNHVRDVHEPSCQVCGKSFTSKGALNQHVNDTGHY